jgi:taurine--2-oxoglutarate transaminase
MAEASNALSANAGIATPAVSPRNFRHRQDFVPWAEQANAHEIPTISGGQGVYFWDDSGKRYLDFSSQLVNTNLGHQHPKIIEAIQAQAAKLAYIGPFFSNEPREKLAGLVAEVAPGDINTSFFATSGTEANEFALTLARGYTGRTKVMARYRSYHGSGAGTLGVSGDPRRILARSQQAGSIRFFPPYCYRCSFGLTYPQCSIRCATSLEQVIQDEGPEDISAIIVEPVTGANGPFIPPHEYYGLIRQICDKYGILMIADEILTGFGRTGKWFGIEHWDVIPDMMTVSKGFNAGALPLGAVLMRDKIARHFDSNFVPVGSTQTANPIACAAGVAALQVYQKEGLIDRAARMGEILMGHLYEMKEKHRCVGDVRGLGLHTAIELVRDREARTPLITWNAANINSPLSARIRQMCLSKGLFVITRWHWINIAPPLIVTPEEIKEGMAVIDEVLAQIDAMI